MPPLLPHVYKFKFLFSSKNSKVGGLLVIPTSDKTSSYHGLALPSSPPLFSSCGFDPSNVDHIEDVTMSTNGSFPNVKDIEPIQSKASVMKKVLGKMGCKTRMGTIVCRGRWNLTRYQM
jgi:hypothetical protein